MESKIVEQLQQISYPKFFRDKIHAVITNYFKEFHLRLNLSYVLLFQAYIIMERFVKVYCVWDHLQFKSMTKRDEELVEVIGLYSLIVNISDIKLQQTLKGAILFRFIHNEETNNVVCELLKRQLSESEILTPHHLINEFLTEQKLFKTLFVFGQSEFIAKCKYYVNVLSQKDSFSFDYDAHTMFSACAFLTTKDMYSNIQPDVWLKIKKRN